MMDYRYRDSRSGPLTALMGVDLHAVELGEGETAGLFPDAASERAFLDEIAEKDDEELGRMARDAVIPGRERLVFP